ncbi:MAG: MEDS domain-containing protein [Pseudomonadota bacterium]|nr:MEDS domain-containing protein [Pseudomonadota bacterium]
MTPAKEVLWGELPPCDHLLHIYDDDASFLERVEGFIADGLENGEAVIVIATASHREALGHRLEKSGIDIPKAICEGRYIALSAQDTLDKFMERGSPDEERFNATIAGVINEARSGGRKVRAFGEMVALLWARGNHSATVRLEYLWNKLLCAEDFPLLCAYPSRSFTAQASPSVAAICAAHTSVIGARPIRAFHQMKPAGDG